MLHQRLDARVTFEAVRGDADHRCTVIGISGKTRGLGRRVAVKAVGAVVDLFERVFGHDFGIINQIGFRHQSREFENQLSAYRPSSESELCAAKLAIAEKREPHKAVMIADWSRLGGGLVLLVKSI